MAEALRPERIVKLKCGHEFHEFCIRGWTIVGKQTVCPNCGEKVDISSVLGSSPWEKNPNMIWGQLLDALLGARGERVKVLIKLASRAELAVI